MRAEWAQTDSEVRQSFHRVVAGGEETEALFNVELSSVQRGAT